jgi:hypothetical protein
LKVLPKLESLLVDEDAPIQQIPQSDDDMLAMARVLNTAFGGDVLEVT